MNWRVWDVFENGSDRRGTKRFPMELGLRYKTLNGEMPKETGIGKTVNILSTGVLFEADRPLPANGILELAISWPAPLNDTCLLNLVARGRIVRSGDGKAVLRIHKSEFKTSARLEKA